MRCRRRRVGSNRGPPQSRTPVRCVTTNVAPAAGTGRVMPKTRTPFPTWPAILPLAVLLLVVPLVPDVQLVRDKLLVLYLALWAGTAGYVFTVVHTGRIIGRLSMAAWLPVLMPAYVVLRSLVATDRTAATGELGRWAAMAAAFVLGSLAERRERRMLLWCWVFGTGCAALYGLAQRWGGVGPLLVPRYDRIMGMSGNPIFFAATLAVFIPPATALAVSERGGLRAAASAAAALALWALVLTGTRAAFLGCGAAAVTMGWLCARSLRVRLAVLILAPAAVAVSALLMPDVWNRPQAHVLIWRDALRLAVRHPVFGVGPGRFHRAFPEVASDELRAVWPQGSFIVNDAHSEYVQLLVETGVIGLAVFLAGVAAVLIRAARAMSWLQEPDRVLTAGLTAGAVALLVQNAFSVDMRFAVSAVYLFFAMGLAVSMITPQFGADLPGTARTAAGRAMGFIASALLLGVVSWGGAPPRVSVLGIAGISRDGIRWGVQDAGWGVLPRILAPHAARLRVSAEPDFFDVRVLDATRTLEELLALQERHPGNPAVEERIGWVYAKERRFEEALRHFDAAVAADPNRAGAWNNAGNVLFMQGRRREAIARYRRALQADPALIDARLNLGIALLHEGLLEEASVELEEVLRRDPGNAKAVMTLRRMRE